MADETSTTGTLAPEEAFSVLGNDVRMELLRVLGEADAALSFSELRDRVGVDDPGRFNYHLNQLAGHFVQQTPSGYVLRRPGERIIEAVLSGAVTEVPVIEQTQVDMACHFCGASPIEVDYRGGQLGVYCTECEGMYGGTDAGAHPRLPAERQRLWYAWLPPAGLRGRSPSEVVFASARWVAAEILTTATGMCPSCSAQIEESIELCHDHEDHDGLCNACNRRYAAQFTSRCTNCVFRSEFALGAYLQRNLEVRSFMIDHGLDPVAPKSERFRRMIHRYEEDFRSVEPLEVAITFTLDGDTLTLVLDDALSVLEVHRSDRS